MPAVVVGIDSSPNSRAALRWAAAEARALSWPLTAIHAAPRPLADTGFGVDLSAADAERHEAAEQLLDETLPRVGAALDGFAGLLLGSTAEHCARHAPCPVTVVR